MDSKTPEPTPTAGKWNSEERAGLLPDAVVKNKPQKDPQRVIVEESVDRSKSGGDEPEVNADEHTDTRESTNNVDTTDGENDSAPPDVTPASAD